MKKLCNTLIFVLQNSLFAICIYLALFKNISGFFNILTFFIWLLFLSNALILVSELAQIDLYKFRVSRYGASYLEKTFDIAMILILAYCGKFILASLLIFTVFSYEYSVKRGKELLPVAKA